jgi:hypothetical protein
MYYNPATEAAVRSLDELAAQNRQIIQKLNPPAPNDIVWSSIEGRWVNNVAAKPQPPDLIPA